MNEQEILLLASLAANALTVSLDKTTAVNLTRITSYRPVEIETLDKEGNPTGIVEAKPAVFFGENDYLELTEEQNKVFRFYWNLQTQASGFYFSLLAKLQPAQPTEAPA